MTAATTSTPNDASYQTMADAIDLALPWAANSRAISGRTFFEPRHGKGPTGWHIVIKPSQAAGRRFGSQPIGPSNATTNTAAHPGNN
jgi:hypothetical protein